MSKYDYSRLQNGSDIRGVAIDGVAGEEVNLDAEAAERIAKGFLYYLVIHTGKPASELTIPMWTVRRRWTKTERKSAETVSSPWLQP